jgi:hypothetical protein
MLLVVAAVAIAAGTAGGSPAKPEHELLYGLVSKTNGSWLARFDPQTLAPTGRRVALGHLDAFVYDTNGWLAYADGRRLRLVNLESMRPVKSIRLWTTPPVAVAWLRWDTIVAVTGTTAAEVHAIDWATNKVVRTALVEGTVVARAEGDDELVLLLAPAAEIGPARLLVVNPAGQARVIPVPRISAGSHFDEVVPPTGVARVPALALDAARDLAYVVGDGLVAEVPLHGSATYHGLRGAFAKIVAGTWFSAAWLGDGTLAIAGSTSTEGRRIEPSGLELVDTRTWTSHVARTDASFVLSWNGVALFTGTTWEDGEERRGIGVVGLDSSGNERFHALPDESVSLSTLTPTRAYVYVDGRRSAIVDFASGRVVARFDRELPLLFTPR